MPDDFVDLDDLPANSSTAEALDGADQPTTKEVVQQHAQPDSPKEGEATSAESSAAQGDKDKFDPLQVVRDVVDKDKRAKEAAASPAEGDETDPSKKGEQKPDDENYTDVPFHKHPRFQHVLRERNAYRGDAERYQNVQTYLDQNHLSAQEAADGLLIMGLAKTNPVEAWKLLQPFAAKVAVAAGALLPPDLQQEVDQGRMSPEVALRLAGANAARQTSEGMIALERRRQQEQRERDHVTGLSGAADTWAADRARKDPNFEAKLPAIQKELLWLHRTEGKPTTPEGVKEHCEKAYKAVNASLPTPVRQNGARPVTPVRGGQVSGSDQRNKPKTTLDVINTVVEQSRRAASA